MGKRIFSTLLLWTIVLLCIRYLGTTGGIWFITIVSALTLHEFYALVSKLGVKPFNYVGIGLGTLITLAPLYFERFGIGALELTALAVIVFSIRILGERDASSRVETLAWTLFGVLYVSYMLHFLVRVALLPGPDAHSGLAMCVWIIAVSKFCDVGALLTGLAFGKHKMAPGISPKKTWEGAVGGVLISAGIGAGIAHYFAQYFPANFSPVIAAVVAMPIAVVAIVSDLIESIIKRRADAKDAGQTIPGIGGIFDLSDSLILTAPIGYAVFHLL